jgi:hypothetical protein
VGNAFIFPFNTQTMHVKPFYTQQHCYVSLKSLYPRGTRTRVLSFLRQMRCPLCHAARDNFYSLKLFYFYKFWPVFWSARRISAMSNFYSLKLFNIFINFGQLCGRQGEFPLWPRADLPSQ